MAPATTVAAEQRPTFNNAVFSTGMSEFLLAVFCDEPNVLVASLHVHLVSAPLPRLRLPEASTGPGGVLGFPASDTANCTIRPRPLNTLHRRFPLSAALQSRRSKAYFLGLRS